MSVVEDHPEQPLTKKVIVVEFIPSDDGKGYIPTVTRGEDVTSFEVPVLLEIATKTAYQNLGLEK